MYPSHLVFLSQKELGRIYMVMNGTQTEIQSVDTFVKPELSFPLIRIFELRLSCVMFFFFFLLHTKDMPRVMCFGKSKNQIDIEIM